MNGSSRDNKRKQAVLVDSIMGFAAFTTDGRLIARAAFPEDPAVIAQIIDDQANGSLPAELPPMLERLRTEGYEDVIFTNESLASAVDRRLHFHVSHKALTESTPVATDPLDVAIAAGFVESSAEFYEVLRDIGQALASKRVSSALKGLFPLLSHAVLMIEELDKSINSMSVKTEEWYGLHFPELGRTVQEHDLYLRLVARAGDRSNINSTLLKESGLEKEASKSIENAVHTSLGAGLRDNDVEMIQGVAKRLLSLNELRQSLECYISGLVSEIAPNATELAGPMLAAKLLCRAGGLQKLALLPSSKIQILGAEKALFRAMRTGARPPKHGLIFQHPLVHSTPRKNRGKAARMLASKIALAARADAFSGRHLGKDLKEDLETRIVLLVKEEHREP